MDANEHLSSRPLIFSIRIPRLIFVFSWYQISWDSVMRMDANLRDLFLYEAFLYYNPLLLVVSRGFNSPVYAVHCSRFLWNFILYLFLFLHCYIQTMMVWLWGVNLWVFLQSTVSYTKVFDLDQNHLTHKEIWKVVRFFAQPSF